MVFTLTKGEIMQAIANYVATRHGAGNFNIKLIVKIKGDEATVTAEVEK